MIPTNYRYTSPQRMLTQFTTSRAQVGLKKNPALHDLQNHHTHTTQKESTHDRAPTSTRTCLAPQDRGRTRSTVSMSERSSSYATGADTHFRDALGIEPDVGVVFPFGASAARAVGQDA